MKPVSVDNVVSTYRFYAPLYDRVFGLTRCLKWV